MKKVALILLAVSVAAGAAEASDARIEPLFTVLAGEVVAPSPAATAVVPVSIAIAQLENESGILHLELTDGPIVEARLTEIERRGPGDLVWRGSLEGGHQGEVTLTLKNGFVAGLIHSTAGVWEIRTQPGSAQSVERLDASLFPACGTEDQQVTPRFPEGDVDPCPSPVDPADQIDVLGYYTPQARDAAGGVAQIEALVQSAVDLSNTAFGNSQMTARFRLVEAALSTRNDSGNMSADLNWLASDAGVAAHRDAVKADLVSLIVNSGGFCGIAQLPLNWGDPPSNQGRAHQVTARTCAVGNLSFPHEHGHNMGLEHDPANANPPGSGTYPFRYGHYVANSTDQARTVMSYNNQCGTFGCPRTPYFSNPSVNFSGTSEPTGILDERQNHRAGDLTDACVTDYRIHSRIFADGFESGDLNTWSDSTP